jgi:hypothetical protein
MSRLDALWADAPGPTGPFDPDRLTHLPEPARRWLTRAIAPGTPLYQAVRLEMRGEIRLGETWSPFTAEQVIRWDRGFEWDASTRMKGLPVSGFDRLIDEDAMMRWKLFGLIPVMTADGVDIRRSAVGRLHGEATWLPTVLLADDVTWSVDAHDHAVAVVRAHGETTTLTLGVDPDGRLAWVTFPRWGDPDGALGWHPFTVHNDGERTADGVTLGAKVRAGWHTLDDGGEDFFRAELTTVQFKA